MLKKLFTLSLIFIGALTLTACGGDDGLTVEEILANITEAVDELALPSTTSTDLTLPNTGVHEVVVTWESSDTDFITDAGVVTIPTLTEGDQAVTMTASLTLEGQTLTKTFTVTVTAATALNDAEKVAADTLALFIAEGETFNDVVLPVAGGNGTTVTWESSHPLVITTAGVVTRPGPDATNVTVTLTATVTSGSESDTKTFDLIVVKNVETIDIDDLKSGYVAGTIAKLDLISVKGVVTGLVTVSNMGFYIYDGTGFLFVYQGSTTPTVEIGDVVLLQGTFDVYYGLPQIKELTGMEEITEVITAPAPAVKTIQDIIDYTTAPDIALFSELLSLTGTITMTDTDYYLEDENGNKLELNDEADTTLLEALVGKNVTVTITYHTYHSGHGFHQVNFSGFATDVVENVLSDADALAADLAVLDLIVPNITITSITLPTTGTNGTVYTAWTSSDVTVLADDGTFVAKALTTVTITYTGTATNGAETSAATFEVVVPIEVALAAVPTLVKDDGVQVTGVVYYKTSYGYSIFANGHFLTINDSSYLDDLAFGDEVTVLGFVVNPYHGLVQINSISYTNNSSSNTVPTYTVQFIGDLQNIEVPLGTLATVTGMVDKRVSGSYTNYYLVDSAGNEMRIHYSGNDEEFADMHGAIVTIDVLVYTEDYLWFIGGASDITTETAFTEVQDANAVAAAIVAELGDVSAVTGDLTLPTTFTAPVATATWATTDAAVVTDAGVVTMAYGNAGYATLTVSVTVGTTTVDKEVHVTVLDGDTLTPTDIATALLEADGETVIVTGVVTGFYYGEPQIQDPLTGIAIHVYDDYETELVVGDLVIIRGVLESYDDPSKPSNHRRLDDTSLIDIVSQDNVVFIRTDVTPLMLATNPSDYYGQVLTMDITANILDSDYGYADFDGLADDSVLLTLKYPEYFDLIYVVDDVLTVTFTVYDFNYGNVRLVNVEFPALTEAEDLLVADAFLDIETTLQADIVLPADMTDYNATIVWATSDAAVITAAGVVTRPAVGQPDGTATLTATITVGSETPITKDFVMTITAEQPVLNGGTEDLTNFDGSTSTYTDSGSYTGAQNVVWTYHELRRFTDDGAYTIGGTGTSGMFGSSGTRDLSADLTGGIATFSIDLLTGYTGGTAANRSIEIFVNDISVGTYTLTAMATVENFEITGINVTGAFTIKIVSTGSKQLIIDNVTWTGYTG